MDLLLVIVLKTRSGEGLPGQLEMCQVLTVLLKACDIIIGFLVVVNVSADGEQQQCQIYLLQFYLNIFLCLTIWAN